ncbi:MAG: hypothetical protein WC721_13675 [Victivallaceae bacterium]
MAAEVRENLKHLMLNDTPKCRSAGGCPVYSAGRMGRAGRRVQNVKNVTGEW